MLESRRYIIWGSSGHAKVIDEMIRRHGGRVVALFDNSPCATSALINVQLIGGKDDFSLWINQTPDYREHFALVAIGGARGGDRLNIQNQLVTSGLRVNSIIHPQAYVADNAVLGAGSQVMAMAVVAANSTIGAACIINHKATVDHECSIEDGVHLAPGVTLCGCVTIGKNTMIGAGATVLPWLRIGTNTVIGAGSVVTCDIPDNVVAIGSPARIVRHLRLDM